MNLSQTISLLKAKLGEEIIEDDDADVLWLVSRGMLEWSEDGETYFVTKAGEEVVEAVLIVTSVVK